MGVKISLQIWASLLSLFDVMAIVLIPARTARFATVIFAFVLPVTDINQYVLDSVSLEIKRSDGL